MKTLMIALGVAAALGAAPAAAEHNGAPRESSTLDLDVKIGGDGFRLGGRVFTDRVYGAWLNGRRTPEGFSVDGRVQGEERAYNFKMNADVLDVFRRSTVARWLFDL